MRRKFDGPEFQPSILHGAFHYKFCFKKAVSTTQNELVCKSLSIGDYR